MNVDDLLEKYKKEIGIFLVLLILISGAILLFSFKEKETAPIIISGEESREAKEEEIKRKFVVDVAGSVVSPGIYRFEEGARIGEAIEKAGGFSPEADQEYIEKQLNQASTLSDGQKIYIPKEGESNDVGGRTQESIAGIQAAGKININTASAALLDTLPGIGEVRSQKIVENRPYKDISELLNKKIIPSNVYEDIKNKIVAN